MALTRKQWEQVRDKFIDTKEMLHTHLVGYDILKKVFTDEQILEYTSNITVYSQYHYTSLATYVGENDYKLDEGRTEMINACDIYGRPIPNKYTTVYRYNAYIRADRGNCYVIEVTENFRGIALSLTNDSKLREFINRTSMGQLYQTNMGKFFLKTLENDFLYGEIKIDQFKNNFSEYEDLLFHSEDNKGNYFGTYEESTRRMWNRVNYYVNLIKLAEHLSK